ncbi:MAG: DedA family protein [Candidatus Dormibacter sp.]
MILLRTPPRVGRRGLAAGVGLALILLLALILVVFEDGSVPSAIDDVGPLIRAAFHSFGGAAAFALLYIEESGIPMVVPGDFVVMWVGHHVPADLAAWVAAWLGLTAMVVLGSSNLYFISRKWGRGLLDRRLGRILHLTPQRMAQADLWFTRWGAWALIFGRHIFGLRVPLTVAAGIFKLPYPVFALSVAVSSAAWIAVFLFLGVTVGGHVAQALRAYRQAAVLIGIAALLVAVVVVIFRFDRSKRAPRRLDSTP